MSCEFCKNLEEVDDINYCPYCGDSLIIRRFISNGINVIKENTRRLIIQAELEKERANETVEIDGETLIVEHIKTPPKSKKQKSTPLNYEFDPDKIDISKEMAMLEKHYNKHPLDKHKDYISERVTQLMKEKENEGII